MLLQLVVENVLSFRDKVVLSLLAADGVPHDDVHCVRLPGLPPVLKCAAIYGANASGKSNLVKVFELVWRLVVDGTKAGEPLPLRRFKLDAGAQQAPSRFEIDLYAAGRRYAYGFVVTPEAVVSEWLLTSDGGEEEMLFEREQPSEGERPSITLGPALTQDAARRQFIAFVAEGTRPNQLFLTEAAERNVGELGAVTRWFRDGCVVVRPLFTGITSDHGQHFRMLRDEALLRYTEALLKAAGTGISRVTVELGPSPLVTISADGQREPRMAPRLEFHHAAAGPMAARFTLDEESDGTRRLMDLAPFLFDLSKPPNGAPAVHVIDELDRSLHPLLTRFFLDTFLRSSSAEHPGQILFTTHDTNLLDLTLLSRDSIWFTEKNASGASSLYSLAEFKGEQLDRIGAHLEEGYLQGRFGAIPFLGDPRRLGWTAPKEG